MAQYSTLKAYIEEKIYENGTQAITGDILQDVLKVMTNDLGEFYQTGGVASPSTDPGTPDAKVIYFATEAGTYTNFGGITLAAGEVALLIFETSWTKETLNVLSSANGGVKTANLADGAVTTGKIANGAVETAKIADASITNGKLADEAVTAGKIQDGAVGTGKIADKAVTTGKLGDKAVTSGKIADKAVGTGQIADEAITEGKIADEAVTAGKIADGAVTNGKINDGAVTEGKIGSGAVTTGKIGAKAVTTDKIADKAVTSGQLGDKAVTSDKIADGAVGSDQLAEGAFSAQNLADGSVTTEKLADDAVTAEKIADGAVTAGKFADGSVSTAKLASGAVITEKIGDGMVTRQKLADSSVGTSKIIDGAVTTDKVADANVTTAKIADANVTTGKLADGAVTTAKIADGNVTGAKLQEGVRPVINVNALNEQTSAYGSAALARAAVPSALRILGLHVIYLLAGGWFEDEFIGSDVTGWGTASNWRAVGPVSVSQNTETGHTEINIGSDSYPVASVREIGKYDVLQNIDYGNIIISTNGWIYSADTTRVCTQEGFTIPLKVGDKIGFKSYNGVSFFLGYRRNDGTYGTPAYWQYADYTIIEDGEYVINMQGEELDWILNNLVINDKSLSEYLIQAEQQANINKEILNEITNGIIFNIEELTTDDIQMTSDNIYGNYDCIVQYTKNGKIKLEVDGAFRFAIRLYKQDGTKVYDSGWQYYSELDLNDYNDIYLLNVHLKRYDNTATTPQDIIDAITKFRFFYMYIIGTEKMIQEDLKTVDNKIVEQERVFNIKQDSELVACDKNGNIIAKIDDTGLNTIDFLTKYKDELYICDRIGNVVVKVDKNGNIDTTHSSSIKNVIIMGDSHAENRRKWLPKLCQVARLNWLEQLNAQLNVGNIVPPQYEMYLNPLIAQAQALNDNIGDNRVDYIIVENVHFQFNGSQNMMAYKPSQMVLLGTFNMTKAEEIDYFDANYYTLLSGISVSEREGRTLLKSIVNASTCVLTFGADSVNAGELSITIDGVTLSTTITDGMSLSDAVEEVMRWQFGDYTDWVNVSKTNNSITFRYNGAGTPSMTFAYNAGTTGITITQGDIQTSTDSVYRYFESLDVSEWTTRSKWKVYYNGWHYGYALLKGFYEKLQEAFPNVRIITLGLADTPISSIDDSFDYSSWLSENSATEERKQKFLEMGAMYNNKTLDIEKLCGITPFNWFTFYNPNTVHPKDNGYERWAETIANNYNF